ncbi:MAG: hypothetical protein HZB99_01570 [Candidatus Harrisonbacteria bacterium]|nr:hypothetical protein [Candidatus Harrisonbacteria bacterium]
MEWFFRAFDLFVQTAHQMATYVPQNGADLLELFKKLLDLSSAIGRWVLENIGINLQLVFSKIGELVFKLIYFIVDVLKQMMDRIS